MRNFVRNWLLKSIWSESVKDQARDFYLAMRRSTQGMKYVLPPLEKDKDSENKDSIINLLASIIFTVTA